MDDQLRALLQSPYATPRNIFSHIPHTAAPDCKSIYQTVPLCGSSSLRLLQLHSSASTGLVSCTLDVFEFSNVPEYTALSYTWGPPSFRAAQNGMTDGRCCPIICNGQLMWITANLLQFLLVQKSVDASFWLWIDAICINQDNVLERNQQLLLMTDIYTRASRTLVWLGEQDEFTEPAIRLLNVLVSVDLGDLIDADPLKDCFYDAEFRGRRINASDWVALTRMLQRSWFGRIWILQEMVVAERCDVVCGTWIMSCNALLQVCAYLACSKSEWDIISRDKDAEAAGISLPYPSLCLNIIGRLRSQLREANHNRFTQITWATYSFQATDPKDKMYALLGLFQWPRHAQDDQCPIIPNYAKSVTDVYTDVTVALLRENLGFVNLSRVGDASFRNRQDLPSWVPNYNADYPPFSIGFSQSGLYSASKTPNLSGQSGATAECYLLKLPNSIQWLK